MPNQLAADFTALLATSWKGAVQAKFNTDLSIWDVLYVDDATDGVRGGTVTSIGPDPDPIARSPEALAQNAKVLCRNAWETEAKFIEWCYNHKADLLAALQAYNKAASPGV